MADNVALTLAAIAGVAGEFVAGTEWSGVEWSVWSGVGSGIIQRLVHVHLWPQTRASNLGEGDGTAGIAHCNDGQEGVRCKARDDVGISGSGWQLKEIKSASVL